MNRQWFIYVLSSDGKDIYVGRTVNPKRRKTQHRARFGKSIEMRLVESGTGEEACKAAEIRWIENLLSQGAELSNRMLASTGAWQTDDETLATLREAGIQMWQDPEYRDKQKAALMAALSDPKYREQRRKSAKEVWERPEGSPEERKALAAKAAADLWRNMTPERLAEIVAKRKASMKTKATSA